MRFQFYCLDVIALAFRILGKNSNQFSVWMYKRIELVFVLLRPGPIRPSSARWSSRSASSMPPSSRRRRARSPGRGGVARRRLRGRDGATRCCCFCRGARARGRAAAARAGRDEEGRGGKRAELAQIRRRAMASTAPHPVAVEGARPPAGRGGVELGHPRWRGWRSAGVREEGGGPSSRRSTTARWPPPRLAPSPWRELGRPRAAAAWRGWRSAGVREEACRGGPSRAAGVEGAGQRGDARANADEYRG